MSYLIPLGREELIKDGITGEVLVASTTGINLGIPVISVDGITLGQEDTVLVKNQNDPAENGLYSWDSGLLVRNTDEWEGNISSGILITVRGGDTQGGTLWILQTKEPIIVGTTHLTFVRISSPTAIQYRTTLALDSVTDGETKIRGLGRVPFNPSEYIAIAFRFIVVLSVNKSPRTGTVKLYNSTDRQFVTGTTLSTSSEGATKLVSPILTVGIAPGDLQPGEKFYQVWLENDGTLVSEKTFLDIAFIDIRV